MTAPCYALFDSPIGRCGIGWGPGGILVLQLPEASDAATRRRVIAQLPRTGQAGAVECQPPAAIGAAIGAIRALLTGEARDLGEIRLDMRGVPPFHARVYDAARKIPPGRTATYGEIATRLGMPRAARAVGQALGRNPFAIIVPCHRVTAAGGKLGGFSANGGVSTKLRLLAIEGAAGAVERDTLFART